MLTLTTTSRSYAATKPAAFTILASEQFDSQ